MFNKTSKPTPPVARPQPTPIPPLAEVPSANLARVKPVTPTNPGIGTGLTSARPSSSIGTSLVIEGNISGSGDLHLDGTVHGDVKVAHLIVGESGNIEGKVEAESIEVRGRIVGSITGKQVKLQASAYVEGDINHEQLAIDVGAYFQGRCLQTRRAEPVAAVSAPVAPAAAPIPAPAPELGTPSLGSYDADALADLK